MTQEASNPGFESVNGVGDPGAVTTAAGKPSEKNGAAAEGRRLGRAIDLYIPIGILVPASHRAKTER